MTAVVERHRASAIGAIDERADGIVALSKFIHDNPEIAMQEFKSSAACADFLEHQGFTVERGIAGIPTAFAARYGTAGPHIAYLSEYDALPGLGHGCGHNLIAIAGISAGLGLKAAIDAGAHGRVTVFGTPAEEAVGGKVLMADAGAFDDVDAALGAHPGTSEAVCPTVEGSGNALACEMVQIRFHGKPAHAAADPYNGRNALDAVIMTFNGINALRQHVKSDARMHGVIRHGGEAPNVIPDFAEAEFFIRAATLAYMSELVEKVRKIAQGAAKMTGTTVDFLEPEKPNSDMITNYTLARQLKQNIDRVGLKLQDAKPAEGSGSTDWGNVSYVTPSVETSYPILDRVVTWHSQAVVEAADSELGYENTLLVGKALALTGIDLLEQPELLDAIKSEFEAAKATRARA